MTSKKIKYSFFIASFILYVISLVVPSGTSDLAGWFPFLVMWMQMFFGIFYWLAYPLYITSLVLISSKYRFASLLCSFFSAVLVLSFYFFSGAESYNTQTFFFINHKVGMGLWFFLAAILLVFIYNTILVVGDFSESSTQKLKNCAKHEIKYFSVIICLLIIGISFSFLLADLIHKPHFNSNPKQFIAIRGHISPILIGAVSLLYRTNNSFCRVTNSAFAGIYSARQRRLFNYPIQPNSKGQFSLQIPMDKVYQNFCKWKIFALRYDFYKKHSPKIKDNNFVGISNDPINNISNPLVVIRCEQFKFQEKDYMVCDNNYMFKEISRFTKKVLLKITFSKRKKDYKK